MAHQQGDGREHVDRICRTLARPFQAVSHGNRDQVASARAAQQQTVPAKAAAQYDNLADDGVNESRGKATLSPEDAQRLNDLGTLGVLAQP
jgi:hypothetical protein